MKCPHCGNKHPDDYGFCPKTGNAIEPQFLICNNPSCNYRQPLPLTAKFCPNCGKLLKETIEKEYLVNKYVSSG